MNYSDRLLEAGLKQMLDPVVRTPPPPRWGRPGHRPLLKIYFGSGAAIGSAATLVVLADSLAEVELPSTEIAIVPAT